MKNMTAVKAVSALAGTAALALTGEITRGIVGLLAVLAALMVTDYLTGVAAAYISGTVSSRAGLKGIVKKLGYLAVVAVAVALDLLLAWAADALQLPAGGGAYASAIVSLWLCCNEGISVLENLARMGVPLPGFLKRAFERLKSGAEDEKDGK